MPKPGRDLELLIARLEAVTSPFPVKIESPGHLPGALSEKTREVDVVVRGAAGPMQLLIVLECRDRARPADVTWVEQLATKKTELGADQIVGVSSSGFSAGAKNMAAKVGVELRSIRSITAEAVRGWIQLTHLRVIVTRFEAVHTSVETYADTPPFSEATTQALDSIDSEAAIWRTYSPRSDTYGPPMSLQDLLELAAGAPQLGELPDDPGPTRVRFTMSTTDDPAVGIETTEGPFPLALLQVTVDRFLDIEDVPPTRVRSYTSADANPTEVVEFDVERDGVKYVASFVNGANGISFGLQESPADE